MVSKLLRKEKVVVCLGSCTAYNYVNFVFPAENETLSSVCLGYEASSLSVSLSMPKVPNKELKTNKDDTASVNSFAFCFKIHSL